ncbi:MAG: hypothetical protein V4478_01585 [Patescibacteria group bacterium]
MKKQVLLKRLALACLLFAMVAAGCKKGGAPAPDPMKENARLIENGIWKGPGPVTYMFKDDGSGTGGTVTYTDSDGESSITVWKAWSATLLKIADPDGTVYEYSYTVNGTTLTLTYLTTTFTYTH